MDTGTFDFVIVGSGAAGCICAEKLSRKFSCLLLEAGGDDSDPVVHEHDQWWNCYNKEGLTWDFLSAPQPNLPDNRRLEPKMGKLLGGSTSHNAMYYVKGNLEDYDRWDSLHGCEGWNTDRFLRAFRALEKTTGGDDRFHGRNGHLQVRRADRNDVFESFSKACEREGIPYTEDSNSDKQLGYGLSWANVTETWERHSTYRAFVHPHLDRSNLTIRTGAAVSRVLLDGGKRAIGVQYVNEAGDTCVAKASREVILSAGAINSPQLLMLSGIGDRDHLESVGVDTLIDLPGVGLHLQDHVFAPAIFSCRKPLPPTKEWSAWHIFGRNDGGWESGRPDFFLLFCAREQYLPGFFRPEEYEDSDLILAAVAVLHPHSKGSVRLASTDPQQTPIINPNYLSDDEDMVAWRRGFSLLSKLTTSDAMEEWVEKELQPACSSGIDIESYVKAAGASMWHLVGTCKMGRGSDSLCVVDNRCRVRGGVSALRVIDASVIPELPSAPTQALTMAVAEIASDIVLEDHASL